MEVARFTCRDADLSELVGGEREDGVGEDGGFAAAEGDEAGVD